MKKMIPLIAVVVGLTATASVFAQAASSGTSGTAHSTYTTTGATQTQTATANVEDTLHSLLGRAESFSSRSDAGSVLVVPSGQMSTENLVAAHEDMNVMSRILADALKQTGVASTGSAWPNYQAYNGDLFSTGWSVSSATPNPGNIFLQGYGVLFTMKVGFPLSPGPDANEPQEPAAKAGGDSVWQKAREDLYEPQTAERGSGKIKVKEEKYSAERVENLKTAIVTSLKHAANIRGLQPGDSVVVTISGQSNRAGIVSMKKIEGTDEVIVVDGANKTVVYRGGLPDDVKRSASTVLTIRAKISDVTAFNKGETNLDQFRQKVQILSHPYLGGKTGSMTATSLVLPSGNQAAPPAIQP
jgi:hypothetical protein